MNGKIRALNRAARGYSFARLRHKFLSAESFRVEKRRYVSPVVRSPDYSPDFGMASGFSRSPSDYTYSARIREGVDIDSFAISLRFEEENEDTPS